MPRTLILSMLLLTAFIAAPAVVAHHPCDEVAPGCRCPDYTYDVNAGEARLRFNEQGQSEWTVAGWYVAVDEVYGVTGTDYIFSIWISPEGNGQPGYQRHDEYCYTADCPDGDCAEWIGP